MPQRLSASTRAERVFVFGQALSPRRTANPGTGLDGCQMLWWWSAASSLRKLPSIERAASPSGLRQVIRRDRDNVPNRWVDALEGVSVSNGPTERDSARPSGASQRFPCSQSAQPVVQLAATKLTVSTGAGAGELTV